MVRIIMRQSRKQTAWKKSRTFGDVKGGRRWPKLKDNIVKRKHSLLKPSEFNELPIYMVENPSKDFYFPITIDDIKNVNLPAIGPKLENHPLFPERTNVEFVEVLPDGSLRMRVWERGSGITMACGTGACATAVAAYLNHKAGRKSRVRMDGGDLQVHWNETDGHVYMTGPAVKVFDGEIEI